MVRGVIVVMKEEKLSSNIYILMGETLQEGDVSVASTSQENSMTTWHHRLGHMSERGLKVLVERDLLLGLKSVSLPFCEQCVIRKQHRLKFDRSTTKSKHILELIHSDVWESSQMSLGGPKYFVSFIDDYSRRLWIYPIKKKSDVFSIFKHFKALVELEN